MIRKFELDLGKIYPNKIVVVEDIVATCCEDYHDGERLYTDPYMKKMHTKKCINTEIDWLINNSSPNSIHKSGQTVAERIEQLRSLIE